MQILLVKKYGFLAKNLKLNVTARHKLRLSCKSGSKTINSSWGRKEEEITSAYETRAFVRVAFAY